jgi:DNA-binding MarR family transcriptional regulator
MVKPEIKSRFTSAMIRFVTAVKNESEICADMCGGFNEKELLIIVFVGEKDNVKMSDIADNLRAPLSTLTTIVDKLVEKQYLTRVHSDADRRVVNVTLLNKGKAAYRTFLKRKDEMTVKVLGSLTAAEQRDFIVLLDKMSSVIASLK